MENKENHQKFHNLPIYGVQNKQNKTTTTTTTTTAAAAAAAAATSSSDWISLDGSD